jgi:hypothetical protein
MKLSAVLPLVLASVPLRAAPVALPTPGLAAPRQAQVAVDPRGRARVVFGDGHTLHATSASVDDLHFSPPMKVGAVPGKLALGMRRGPRIAASRTHLLVTAVSHEEGRERTVFTSGATGPESELAAAAPAGAGFLAVWEEPHGHAVRLRAARFE